MVPPCWGTQCNDSMPFYCHALVFVATVSNDTVHGFKMLSYEKIIVYPRCVPKKSTEADVTFAI